MGKFLWFLIIALFAFWILGLALKIGGALIHFVLVIAGIIFIFQLVTGRKSK